MANDRTVYRSTQRKAAQQTWREVSDRFIRSFPKLPSPASLHPDHRMSHAAACGSGYAKAIINSWRPCLAWQSLVVTA